MELQEIMLEFILSIILAPVAVVSIGLLGAFAIGIGVTLRDKSRLKK